MSCARWCVMLIAGTFACGDIVPAKHDAAAHDAAQPDVALEAPPPSESRELTSGGVLTGGGYSLEVQLGHSVQQGMTAGPIYRLEGNAAVKP